MKQHLHHYTTGRHWCNDVFQSSSSESFYCIHNEDLFPIFESRSTMKLVNHNDIYWNPRHFNPEKYQDADISFPGILAEGVPNATNKKFRLIDGRHRIEVMKRIGITESLFNVITQEEFFASVIVIKNQQ